MLALNGLTLRRGARVLFSEATVTVHAGQKAGIIGANGSGKSSLFELLLGRLQADAGELQLPTNLEVAHVAQETPGVEISAIEYAIDGDQPLRKLQAALAEAESAGDGNQIGHLHSELEAIDAYTATTRAAKLLNGLGFVTEQHQNPVRSFSGGWRMRLNLAQALMCRSDILLLDEPTNHLDLDAVIWLEGWLKHYPGTLLLISHDRDFLDNVATHIIHLEQQKLKHYTGNYTAFERLRAEQLASQQSAHEKQQREIAHMQDFVRRFRAKASKAKQAQSRLTALNKMELIAAAHVDSQFSFSFKTPEKLPRTLMSLDEVEVGYGQTPLLRDINITLMGGDRIGLLGPNGAGKSTLIKLLAGSLPPLAGKIDQARELKLGYFAQHTLEQLHAEQTPKDHIQQLDPKARDSEIRQYLGGFGFSGEMALTPIETFSGGEKARLVLAILIYQKPNLLLLDEPTNHLDLEMRQALAVALQSYDGAMIIVSHDRHLLRSVCDDLMLVDDGAAKPFDGDLDDYAKWLIERNSNTSNTSTETIVTANSATARKQKKRDDAERRKRLQPLIKQLQKIEKSMSTIEAKLGTIEQQLLDEDLYQAANKLELKDILSEQSTLKKNYAEAEEGWLNISEEIDAFES